LSDTLDDSARLFDEAAAELELAAQHCRTAAGHLKDGEVPRGAAHAWAATGYMLEAEDRLGRQARVHASRLVP
jgi:hypothetical protein